ncbi:M35 family metallo-endopeptidase [Chondromyces apiculatus]|nr:M35 family metallo-endopeptidase [Chondromyces apiculatus]
MMSLLGGCVAPGDEEDLDEDGDVAASELQITLSGGEAVLTADDEVTIDVTFTNTSSAPVRLLKWYLGGDKIQERLFEVTRDGEPVAYVGPMVKRGVPGDADYLSLEPGESLTRTVLLSEDYDLTEDGDYEVRYDVGALHEGAVLYTNVGQLRSKSMTMFLEGRWNERILPEETLGKAAGQSNALGYSGACTTSEQSTIASAVAAAQSYANESYNYLNTTTPSATNRYKTWFGAYTSSRWTTAKTHFNAIKNAFANQNVVVDCSCNDSYFAYVYPTAPYKIYVCNAFWSAPLTGTDSKAGTLVHEMSHFNAVAGTDDHAYGHTAAKKLATNTPTKALDNADNHEYFAENTPALP